MSEPTTEPTVLPADTPAADSVPLAAPVESIHPAEPVFDDNGNIEPAAEVVPFGTPITTQRPDGSTFFSRTYTVPSLDHDIENLRNAFKLDVGDGFTFAAIRVDVEASYGDVEETPDGHQAAPTFTAVVQGTGQPIQAPVAFQP